MALSILDFANKNKNRRFIDRLGEGEEYNHNVVYTEVLGNDILTTIDNGVFRFSASNINNHQLDIEKNELNMELHIPKIPYKYYVMLIDWYRDVYNKKGTEACLLFYWNQNNLEIPKDLWEENKDGIILDGQLIVICPKQRNHATVSKYSDETYIEGRRIASLPPMIAWLEENTWCVMESHSHHIMTASWSGEDDLNERNRKLRLTSLYGQIKKNSPQNKARICLLGNFYDVSVNSIFEFPKEIEFEVTEKSKESENNFSEFRLGSFKEKCVTISKKYSMRTLNSEEYENCLLEIENLKEDSSKEVSILKQNEICMDVTEPTTDEELRFPSTWWNMYEKITQSYTGSYFESKEGLNEPDDFKYSFFKKKENDVNVEDSTFNKEVTEEEVTEELFSNILEDDSTKFDGIDTYLSSSISNLNL